MLCGARLTMYLAVFHILYTCKRIHHVQDSRAELIGWRTIFSLIVHIPSSQTRILRVKDLFAGNTRAPVGPTQLVGQGGENLPRGVTFLDPIVI